MADIINYPGGPVDIEGSEFLAKVKYTQEQTGADSYTVSAYINSGPGTAATRWGLVTFAEEGREPIGVDAFWLNQKPSNAIKEIRATWGMEPIPGLPEEWQPPQPASPIGERHPRSSKWYRDTGAGNHQPGDIITAKLDGRDQRFRMVRILKSGGGFFSHAGGAAAQYENVWETIA